MPLPFLFAYYSIFFGSLTWLQNRYVEGNYDHNSAVAAAIGGLFFGIFMTFFTLRARQKFSTLTRSDDPLQQGLLLNQAVKRGELPTDKHTLEILPDYIEKTIKTNRRLRVWGPIEFGFFALLGLYILISSYSPAFYFYEFFFIGLAIFTYVGPTRRIERLQRLQAKLLS